MAHQAGDRARRDDRPMTALPNSGRVCQTCRYCDHQGPKRFCRKYAPRTGDMWPSPVDPTEWCGEHQWSELHRPKEAT